MSILASRDMPIIWFVSVPLSDKVYFFSQVSPTFFLFFSRLLSFVLVGLYGTFAARPFIIQHQLSVFLAGVRVLCKCVFSFPCKKRCAGFLYCVYVEDGANNLGFVLGFPLAWLCQKISSVLG